VPTTFLATTGTKLSANVTQLQNLSNRQLLAFEVECLAYELQAYGGVDYRTNHPQLRQDAVTLLGAFPLNDNPLGNALYNHVEAANAWASAYNKTSAIGTDVSAIIILTGRLSETPSSFLCLMILYLRYCLAVLSV
jgi:hypothetical protein